MNILIITDKQSDLSRLIEKASENAVVATQAEADTLDLTKFDSFCILGGCNEEPTVLNAFLREKLENEYKCGKKIFCEYVNSFSEIFYDKKIETSHHRLVCASSCIDGLSIGDLLDDENNTYIKTSYLLKNTQPILIYRDYVIAHRHTDEVNEEFIKNSDCGLWQNDNLLFATFRLCNFNLARFAPRKNWQSVIDYIVTWMTGNNVTEFPESVVKYNTEAKFETEAEFEAAKQKSINKAIKWLKNMLVNNGINGIKEGMSHSIKPDGVQIHSDEIRTDCTGEASGVFLFDGILNNNAEHYEIGKNLQKFVFGPMVEKGGLYDGMLRWTETCWGTCYGDDVARAILPTLYIADATGKCEYKEELTKILDFLVKTTSDNGIRIARTDMAFYDEAGLDKLKSQEVKITEHHNAYYQAALALGYKILGKKTYIDIAEKGMETAMSVYPETYREQSETEEMCRMILPLALLFDITKKEKYKKMLYRVSDDLEKLKHPFGGYCEWDTGYKANRSRLSKTECSLLSENGDPVADQLYSVNWLPIGFAFAYKATCDEIFKTKWKNIVKYFILTQMESDDENNDGGWTRGFDMEIKEAYGVPHDVGWAVYAVESGWSVAEIAMGMMIFEFYG